MSWFFLSVPDGLFWFGELKLGQCHERDQSDCLGPALIRQKTLSDQPMDLVQEALIAAVKDIGDGKTLTPDLQEA